MITAVNRKTTSTTGEQFQPVNQVLEWAAHGAGPLRKGVPVHLVVTPEKGAAGTGENVYQIGIGPRDETAYRNTTLVQREREDCRCRDHRHHHADRGRRWKAFQRTRVSIKQLQGPVGISHMAGQAVRKGPPYVVTLMVVISINLGILNLLADSYSRRRKHSAAGG